MKRTSILLATVLILGLTGWAMLNVRRIVGVMTDTDVKTASKVETAPKIVKPAPKNELNIIFMARIYQII